MAKGLEQSDQSAAINVRLNVVWIWIMVAAVSEGRVLGSRTNCQRMRRLGSGL